MINQYNPQTEAFLRKRHADRKVIIHLGMPKTGSTWLQTYVFPKLRSFDVCHRESLRCLMLGWSSKKQLISYENYVGYPYLLESRDLDGWMITRKRAFNNLSFLFPNADIILVVRKQTDLVKSLYNQYIRIGGSLNFHEYISGNSKYSLDKKALEYTTLINQIRDYFAGKLLLVNYRLFKDNKEMFGKVFKSFIGSKDSIDFKGNNEIIINRSLSEAQITYLKLFNRMVYTMYSPSGLNLPGKRTYRHLRKLILSTASMISSDKDYGVYCKEEMAKLEEYFLEDWNRLKAAMKGDWIVIGSQKEARGSDFF